MSLHLTFLDLSSVARKNITYYVYIVFLLKQDTFTDPVWASHTTPHLCTHKPLVGVELNTLSL